MEYVQAGLEWGMVWYLFFALLVQAYITCIVFFWNEEKLFRYIWHKMNPNGDLSIYRVAITFTVYAVIAAYIWPYVVFRIVSDRRNS